MDQQPYLQGYVPVVLLTLAASTKQQILNGVIESGPAFIEASPSEAQESCEVKMFETCAAEAGDASSPKSSSTTTNNNNTSTGLIAGLSVVAVVFFLAFVFVGYRMNKLSAHVRELESRGVRKCIFFLLVSLFLLLCSASPNLLRLCIFPSQRFHHCP